MTYFPIISVSILHDYFDLISLTVTVILGSTSIYSLWLSRRALSKSEFDSAMNTCPSIILRPKDIWVGIHQKEEYHGSMIMEQGSSISNQDYFSLNFNIEFECTNVGRGMAFNISKPYVSNMKISGDDKTPLFLGTKDEAFNIRLCINGKFEELYEKADEAIPVEFYLTYENDQNNILCKSIWRAKIRPFERQNGELKVREIRLLERSSKIEYSQTEG